MTKSTPTRPPKRRDRLISERIHDPYRQDGQLQGPAVCPQCAAVYAKGRWSWTMAPRADATETLCSACRRIAENCPAGELNLVGEFVTQHREEIRNLVRNIEQVENREHPVNRIMELRELDDRILVTTTDIHLPRRIGTALERAFKGKLDIHFDEGGYFTRVEWRRD